MATPSSNLMETKMRRRISECVPGGRLRAATSHRCMRLLVSSSTQHLPPQPQPEPEPEPGRVPLLLLARLMQQPHGVSALWL